MEFCFVGQTKVTREKICGEDTRNYLVYAHFMMFYSSGPSLSLTELYVQSLLFLLDVNTAVYSLWSVYNYVIKELIKDWYYIQSFVELMWL